MQSFCRTCFLEISDTSSSAPLDRGSYKHRLMFCVPEMDLRAFPGAKLCKDCVAALEAAYKFKIKCCEVEGEIKRQFNVTERLTVKQEMILDNAFSAFCRICVEDVIDCSSYLAKWPFYKSKLMLCVPEMDLQLTSDIKLCNDCHAMLDEIYLFKRKCLDVEKNIEQYLKSHDVVDFRDLSVWCNAFVKCEAIGSEDYTIKQEVIDLDNELEIMEDAKEQTINDNLLDPLRLEEVKACKCGEETLKCRNCKCNDVEHFLPNTTKNNSSVVQEKYNLLEHARPHTGERPFKCLLCDYSAAQKSTLKMHILTHTGEKPFKCSLCDYSSVQKSKVKTHIRTHTGEKPFKCSFCEYSAKEKSALKIHFRIHTGEKPFKCSFCDYSAKEKSKLIIHVRTHTGEKPFKCSLCEYSAANKSALKIHSRTHTGEKPFKCSLCEYGAKEKSTLKRHIRTHTGEKPFKCSLCEYSSAHTSTLKKHIRTHTDEKPFKCSLCEFSAEQVASLDQHICARTAVYS